MLDLLIKNADVIHTTPGGVSVESHHDIAVQGNRIDAIMPTGQIETSP
jgi:hypothetical protein